MGRRKLVKILLESPEIQAELTNQQNETAQNIAERKKLEEIVTMIRHPPPVKKPSEEIITAEINNTHDTLSGGEFDIKLHHKKVNTLHFGPVHSEK